MGMTRTTRATCALLAPLMTISCSFGVDLKPFFDGWVKGGDAGAGSGAGDAATLGDGAGVPGLSGDAGAGVLTDSGQVGVDSAGGTADSSTDAALEPTDAAVINPQRCSVPNILQNGDIEAGFSLWQPYSGTFDARGGARHTGLMGLHICGTDEYGVLQNFALTGAGTFRVRAWVRRFSGPTDSYLKLVLTGGGSVSSAALPIPGSDWNCIESSVGSSVNAIALTGNGPGAGCIDLDDVEFFRVPAGGVPADCRCP
jgi:hypothetical protein